MGFLSPKAKLDPELEAKKAAERAVKIDATQQAAGAEDDRIWSMFGKKSLLSGGGTPGAGLGAASTMFKGM